jgi:hypothetical protein
MGIYSCLSRYNLCVFRGNRAEVRVLVDVILILMIGDVNRINYMKCAEMVELENLS